MEPFRRIDEGWDRILGHQPREGIEAARQALEELAADGEGDSPDAANGWCAVAAGNLALGHVDLALEAASRAIHLADGFGAVSDPSLLRLRLQAALWHARALRAAGDYAGARSVLERQDRSPARPREDRLELWNELGVTLKLAGDPETALACYREVLARVGTEPSHLLATLFHNVGGAYHALGTLDDAELHARRGLVLRRQVFPPDPLSEAADQIALAAILVDRERFDDAVSCLQPALATYRNLISPEHPELGFALTIEARVAHELGETARAVEIGAEALSILTRALGAHHPDTSYARSILALALCSAGAPQAAHRQARQAALALEQSLGGGHARTREATALAASIRRRRERS